MRLKYLSMKTFSTYWFLQVWYLTLSKVGKFSMSSHWLLALNKQILSMTCEKTLSYLSVYLRLHHANSCCDESSKKKFLFKQMFYFLFLKNWSLWRLTKMISIMIQLMCHATSLSKAIFLIRPLTIMIPRAYFLIKSYQPNQRLDGHHAISLRSLNPKAE